MPPFVPHDYQRRARAHVLETTHCALWMECGLGKSAITLSAIEALLDSGDVRRVLVVAPLRVARSTWPAEVVKWGFRLTVSVVTGTPAQRQRALAAPADAYVINYEQLPWLVKTCGKRWPFGMLVLDEATKVKNRSTARWRALASVRGRTERIVELTGTPAPNGLLDLWAPLALLDRGARLGRSLSAYRQRWFDSDFMGYTWTPKPGADAQIHAALADICLTMRAQDYLQLPDYYPVTVHVDLPHDSRALYQELEHGMFSALAGVDVTATNAAAVSSKCQQVCAGAIYHDEGQGTWTHLHDAKIDALRDLMDDQHGAPVLVAYRFRSDRERLRAAFPAAVDLTDDPAVVQRWNCGKIPLLLAYPGSAGYGLNLQDGGNVIVWFNPDWNLEYYQQFNARLHRQGQTKPVFIYHVVARDSVDELILNRLATKRSVQDILMEALKLRRPGEGACVRGID
ncbi:DEAD/DEAH box helicase [uncultured Thiodictyon sp.]|uniref:DEAD/DEAH box helicase n=1 Tax=uncultured Thiodictyon sp. TaxID=1846217 RepID=UPI0025DA06EA|nr:DEAD/DEAH box helicase [uncultured Thiodictyon sp.]